MAPKSFDGEMIFRTFGKILNIRICFEMIKKLFEVKFLHLLPGYSGQIGTAIFPEPPVEPEVFSSQTFR